MFYILGILFILGLLFKYVFAAKSSKKKKIKKTLLFNYIGNIFLVQTVSVFYIINEGINSFFFLLNIILIYIALILHVKDITGKPINIVYSKLNFSKENLVKNIYVRITYSLEIVFLILFLISLFI